MPFTAPNPNLGDLDTQLMYELYAGIVERGFSYSSIMREIVPVRTVTGTDTISNRRLGGTTLKALRPGVREVAQQRAHGKVALTIDTVILARDATSLLSSVQADYDYLAECGQDHGTYIARFFDQAFLIQAIKGALLAAPDRDGTNGTNANLQLNFKTGLDVTLDAVGDELDGDKVYTALEEIVEAMLERDQDPNEFRVYVRPKVYGGLVRSNKLISTEYSGMNGSYAGRVIKTVAGLPVFQTARFPGVEAEHLLGSAYNTSAAEARAQVVLMAPRSLLAGEAIPLRSDVWYNREEHQWFADSLLSFGVTPNRPDMCAAIFAAAP